MPAGVLAELDGLIDKYNVDILHASGDLAHAASSRASEIAQAGGGTPVPEGTRVKASGPLDSISRHLVSTREDDQVIVVDLDCSTDPYLTELWASKQLLIEEGKALINSYVR